MKRFPTPILVTRPYLPDLEEFKSGLAEIWQNQWLTNDGPMLKRFHASLAEYLGVPEASLNRAAVVEKPKQFFHVVRPHRIVATYGRSLYALVIGLFCGRWTLMALGEVDYGLMGVVGGLTEVIGFFFWLGAVVSVPTCGEASWYAIIYVRFSSLNEPWCESPRRYGVEESLAHIFCKREAA